MTRTLEVLGCNATAPGATGAASSYLLHGPEGTVLVDAGPGSLLAYARGHDLADLSAIVVTHLHADHSLDLMAWAYRWTFPEVLPPIPLLVPGEELRRLRAFDDLFGIPSLPTMRAPIASAFDVVPMDLDAEAALDLAGWRLTPRRVHHAVPSAGLRFEADGVTVAFSSDTGPCAALVETARDVDLFVCESTYLTADDDAIHGHGHLTPELAAQIAQEAGAAHLLLTHFAVPAEAEEMGRVAARTFPGPVSVAREGLVCAI